MSAELACVAGPIRSVASGGTPISVALTPACRRPFPRAAAAVMAPGSFG